MFLFMLLLLLLLLLFAIYFKFKRKKTHRFILFLLYNSSSFKLDRRVIKKKKNLLKLVIFGHDEKNSLQLSKKKNT